MDAFMPFDVNSEAVEAVDWYDRRLSQIPKLTRMQVQNSHRTARLLVASAQVSRQLLRPAYVPLRRHLLGQRADRHCEHGMEQSAG